MRIVSQAKYRHMCIGVYTHAGAEMNKRWHMLRRLSLHILSGRCLFAWWRENWCDCHGPVHVGLECDLRQGSLSEEVDVGDHAHIMVD